VINHSIEVSAFIAELLVAKGLTKETQEQKTEGLLK
jgi:hypothetical protein